MDECKTCASCHEVKAVDAFHVNSKRSDGREPYCKPCRRAMRQGLNPRRPDPNRIEAGPGEKLCARCRTCKPVTDFPPGKKWQDGLFPYCRDCKRAGHRADHAKHRAQRNRNARADYLAKTDEYKARARAAYYADRDKVKSRSLEWAAANPERRLEIRTASFRKAWEADPERFREAWRKRQAAIRRGCKVYAVTVDQIAAKVAYWGHKCWMCGGPYDSLDHVKPLAKGGAHVISNIRPACTGCNSRKRDRWPYTPAA